MKTVASFTTNDNYLEVNASHQQSADRHGKLTFAELRARRNRFNERMKTAAEEILEWALAAGFVAGVVELALSF